MGSTPSKRGSLVTLTKPLPFLCNLDSNGMKVKGIDDKGIDVRDSANQENGLIKQHDETQRLQVQEGDRKLVSSSPVENVARNIPKSPKDIRKQPPRVLQASYRQCLLLQVKVLRGHNITLGSFDDWFDTPDPYVKLFIPTSPNGFRKTKVKRNEVNPIWDEVFYFYLDPTLVNLLQIMLIDSDTISDDLVEAKTFDLGTLELNKTHAESFSFREVSKVDMEMHVEVCTSPDDLRYSTDLCREEKRFLLKRKDFVFESMRSLLGERGPQTIEEVPKVAILGSGGGFRAMVSLSGVYCALKDMGVLDCAMYAAGLSGSAWYLSTLYSHPDWPNTHPRVVRDELRDNIDDNWVWMMLTPSWLYRHLKILAQKKRRGQPVSFTDFFGYLVGETILKDRHDNPILSEQQNKVQDAQVPFPIYSCVHVKKDVSAKEYCEWMEFSPYEVGMPKYGTFMRTEYFASKFFCGKLVAPYPEPPLYYLQGIWGSAFTILFQRVLHEGKLPSDTIEEMRNKGDLRDELEEMMNEKYDDEDDSDSDNEEDDDDTDDKNNNNPDEKTNEQEDEEEGFFGRLFDRLSEKFTVLKTRSGRAGLVHNFLRGLEVLTAPVPSEEMEELSETADELALTAKHIYLVDSGLVFNSPYPPLLRPEREVDVFLSFDFSARNRDIEFPFQELLLAEEWAKKNNFKFPPIKAELHYKKYGMKEFYVFRDPKDPTCPVVIHFVLVNKRFKKEIKPGFYRQTKEEKDFANFSLFEDRHNWYSTFNFHYHAEQFNRLADLNEYNTLLGEQTIMDVIADCIKKRRLRFQASETDDESSDTLTSGLTETKKKRQRNADFI